MKKWEKCLKDAQDAMAKRYEAFAKANNGGSARGNCAGIDCDFCPMTNAAECEDTSIEEAVKILNEEVETKETYKGQKRTLNEKTGATSMKEVTEWDNNPREMLVWDDNPDEARRFFVVYIRPKKDNSRYPVLVCINSIEGIVTCKHCAEIEDEKQELMTHKELARWLREKPDREYMLGDTHIYSTHTYTTSEENEPLDDDSLVREGDGEWKKALKSLLDENWHYGKEFGEDW